jgi:hypothetical protein
MIPWNLNRFYRIFYVKVPFTPWANILNFKNIIYIYVGFGLLFEGLPYQVDMQVCSFFFIY